MKERKGRYTHHYLFTLAQETALAELQASEALAEQRRQRRMRVENLLHIEAARASYVPPPPPVLEMERDPKRELSDSDEEEEARSDSEGEEKEGEDDMEGSLFSGPRRASLVSVPLWHEKRRG